MKRLTLWTTRFTAMMLLTMSLCLVGCGEKDSSNPTDPTNPEIPDTPVVPSDSETIPTSGGTVTKGDITISFPSGTFSSDTKVSVTEVAAGQTLGEDEISKFYKLVVPLNTQQSFKVSIKSSETTDVALVAHAPSASTHDLDRNTSYSDIILPSTYANGTYTAEIPKFENNGETANVDVTFGLARIPNDITGTRSTTRAVDDGNIRWTISWKEYRNRPERGELTLDINEAFEDAVTVIKALGFKVKGDRNILVDMTTKDMKPGEYGVHEQSCLSDSWNCIHLNAKYLFDSNYDKVQLRKTVLHELFHYFQAGYDTRICFKKAKFIDKTILRLMEAGGVWIEQFFDKQQYYDAGWKTNFNQLLLSATQEGGEAPSAGTIDAQQWGYGSSLILQWFSHEKTPKSIVKLYEAWRDQGVDSFEDWVRKGETATGCKFFESYGDFILLLASGKLVKGLEDRSNAPTVTRSPYNVSDFDFHGRNLAKDGSLTQKGTILPYGCWTDRLGLKDYDAGTDGSKLNNKQITIKQKADGAMSQAFYYNTSTKEMKSFSGLIYTDKPLVINDQDILKSLLKPEAGIYVVSYALDTNGKKETSEVEFTIGEGDNPMKNAKGLRFDLKWRNENVFTIGSHWTWAGEFNNHFSSSIGWSGYDVLEFASSNDASGDVVLTGRQIKPSSTIAIQSNSSFTLEDQYKLPGDYTSDTSMEVIVAADLKNNKVVLKSGWLKYHYKANQNIGSGKTYGKTADELLEVELRFKDIVAEETITDWTKPNKWDWQHFTITDANLEKGTWTGTYFKRISNDVPYQKIDESITNGWNITIELVLHQK